MITRSKESYRVWYVCICDLETSNSGNLFPSWAMRHRRIRVPSDSKI